MSGAEITNLVASIVSLLMGVGAIALSIVFFLQAKKAESATEAALAALRQQTTSLETLSGRMLVRLTKAVTTAGPADELNRAFVERLTAQPAVGTAVAEAARDGTATDSPEDLLTYELSLFFYSAIANVTVQTELPTSLADLDVDDFVKSVVDASSTVYESLKESLEKRENDIRAMGDDTMLLYDWTKKMENDVRDTLTRYKYIESLGANEPNRDA